MKANIISMHTFKLISYINRRRLLQFCMRPWLAFIPSDSSAASRSYPVGILLNWLGDGS